MSIIILDHTLTQQTIISSFESFDYERNLNKKGRCQLTVNANMRQARIIEVGHILYVLEEVCFYVQKIEEIAEGCLADYRLVITGIELKDVIGSRVTSPPSGDECYRYTQQSTEHIVRDLIDKHFIHPTDVDKCVPIFRLGNTHNVGKVRDYSTRFKQLDTQIYELLLEDRLGLKASVDLETKLVSFSVYEGVDRTIGQKDRPPALFSLGMGTLSRANTLWDDTAYRNVGYVGGKGEGEEREIVEVRSEDTVTGLDRWEIFIDARNAESTEEITSHGVTKLQEHRKVFSVDGTANDNGRITYGLGDWVTIEDKRGHHQSVQITGIKTSMKGVSRPSIGITFGDAPMDIAQAINSRLSGLKNILTQ